MITYLRRLYSCIRYTILSCKIIYAEFSEGLLCFLLLFFFLFFFLNFNIELRTKVDDEVEKSQKVLHKHFRLFLGNGGKCYNKIKFISVEWTIFHHDSPIGLDPSVLFSRNYRRTKPEPLVFIGSKQYKNDHKRRTMKYLGATYSIYSINIFEILQANSHIKKRRAETKKKLEYEQVGIHKIVHIYKHYNKYFGR